MKALAGVNCITFTQRANIGEAPESALDQRTGFRYEILAHDDASTDRAPEIISRFADSHPEIVKLLHQAENQYSQGIEVLEIHNNRAINKYITPSEEDEYWIDPRKLQKRADLMERHPNCSLSVHASHKASQDRQSIGEVRSVVFDERFSTASIVTRRPGMFATCSNPFRVNLTPNLPRFYYDAWWRTDR